MSVEAVDLQDDLWSQTRDRFQMVVETAKRDWAAQLLRKFPDKDRLLEIAESLRLDLGTSGVEVNSLPRIPLVRTPSEVVIGSWTSVPITLEGVRAGAVCTLEEDCARIWSPLEHRRIETAAHQVQEAVGLWFHKANKGQFL